MRMGLTTTSETSGISSMRQDRGVAIKLALAGDTMLGRGVATRLVEAGAEVPRGRRRSASAAMGRGPVRQQRIPEEQRLSARS
jgi:hypothetical protein